jgi:hypothetical protein
MNDTRRWVLILVVVLLVIGLVAAARGREHRRGDDVGALGSPVASSVTERSEVPH